MADKFIEFGGDTGGLETAIAKLNKAFGLQNNLITKVTRASAKLNKHGGIVSKTLQVQAKNGRKAAVSLVRVTDAAGKLTNKYKVMRVATESLEEAEARRQRKNRRITEQRLRQLRAINKAHERALKMMQKENAEAHKQTQQRRRNLSADRFSNTGFKEIFGSIDRSLGTQQIDRIHKAREAVARLIRQGKITATQFKRVGKAIQKDFTAAFTGSDAVAAQAHRRIQAAMKSTGGVAREAAAKVILSWTGVARLFISHSLHLMIGRVINSFTDMIKVSAELDTRIAEIGTIADDAAFSFDRWRHSIIEISNAFGTDATDVASAAYQALSNQVAQGIEVFGFLRTAGEFARVTNSKLSESVDLLSSAMNAYADSGLSASRASQILFKVIELGRVRSVEMKDTLGSIAVIAAQLSISFEELGASIATLTIQGVKYDKAATLIRAIMLKLIKPTDAMKNLIQSWGVETGQAAIQAFGFAGVLQKLQKEAVSGGVKALGDLGGRIRAIVGLAGLTGPKAFDAFGNALQQINEQSEEAFEAAKKLTDEALGVRFNKQIQQIKNSFQDGIGQDILAAMVETLEDFGGAGAVIDSFITSLSDMARQGAILLSVFKPYGALLATIADFTVNVSGQFKILMPVLTAVAARIAIGKASLLTFGLASANLGQKMTTLRVGMRATSRQFDAMQLRVHKLRIGFLRWRAGMIATHTSGTKLKSTLVTMRLAAWRVGDSIKALKAGIMGLRVSFATLTLGATLLISLFAEMSFAAERSRELTIAALSEAAAEANRLDFEKTTAGINKQSEAFNKNYEILSKKYLGATAEAKKRILEQADAQTKLRKETSKGLGIDLDQLAKDTFGDSKNFDGDAILGGLLDSIKESQDVVKDLIKDAPELRKTYQIVNQISKLTSQGKIDFAKGNVGDAERAFEQAANYIKQIEGSDPLGKIAEMQKAVRDILDNVHFETLLPQKQLDSLLNTFNRLEGQARGEFLKGNIVKAAELFSQADQYAEKFRSSLEKLNKSYDDFLSDIQNQIKEIDFEKLDSKGLEAKIKTLNAEAKKLFRDGNLEDAKKKFADVDALYAKLIAKQEKFNSTTKGLGIAKKTGAKDAFDADLRARARFAAENRPDLKDKVTPKQVARANFLSQQQFESKLNELKQARIDLEIGFQKEQAKTVRALKQELDIAKAMVEQFDKLKQKQQNATQQAKDATNAVQQNTTRVNDAVNAIRESYNATANGGFFDKAAFSNRQFQGKQLRLALKEQEKIQIRIAQISRDENLTDEQRTAAVLEEKQKYLGVLEKLNTLLEETKAKQLIVGNDGLSDQIKNYAVFTENLKTYTEALRQSLELQTQAQTRLAQFNLPEQAQERADIIKDGIDPLKFTFEKFIQRIDFLLKNVGRNNPNPKTTSFTPQIRSGLGNPNRAQPTQTVNVGDINLNIDGAGLNTEDELYQALASRLQRDIRRGVIKFDVRRA